jgi:hypothetical protein
MPILGEAAPGLSNGGHATRFERGLLETADADLHKAATLLGVPAEALRQFGHRFFIIGELVIKQGDDVVARGYNKIVGQGLRHIINMIGGWTGLGTIWQANGIIAAGTAAIRLGTGTGPTVDGTATLVNQNNTAPNTVSTAFDTPATSTYRFRLTATWNAGSIPQITVTELGIFGTLASLLGQNSSPQGTTMFSRMSVTDGEFASFTVNTAVPLSVEWRVSITFA